MPYAALNAKTPQMNQWQVGSIEDAVQTHMADEDGRARPDAMSKGDWETKSQTTGQRSRNEETGEQNDELVMLKRALHLLTR